MAGLLRWLQDRLSAGSGNTGAEAAASPPTSTKRAPPEPGPLALLRRGLAAQAEAAASRRLEASPDDAEALLVRALARLDQGQALEAVRLLEAAIATHPAHPGLLSAHGQALAIAGRRKEAQAALQRARELAPHSGEPLLAQARVALAARREDEAVKHLEAALELDPSLADAHHELARLLHARDRLDEAIDHGRQAVASEPDHADALLHLGRMYRDRGRLEEAAVHLERALAVRPDWPAAQHPLGLVRVDQRRWEDAFRLLGACAEATPRDAEVQYWLGNAAMATGRDAEARRAYQAAVRADGRRVQARWGLAMAQLPAIPATAADQDAAPEAFRLELAKMRDWFRAHPEAEGQRAVGAQQPFYLAYVPGNHRAVLGEYGALCTTLMGAWARKVGAPKPQPSPGPRCRVGIVSAHVHSHSVWHALVKGWVEHLDPARFEVVVFHTGQARDAETEWASRRAARLVQGQADWTAWARTISEARCDVVIHPEIGMDSTTTRLATLRLAPVQLASWGHPITTGLPTIDAYLGAEAFEDASSSNQYTEKLVRLPRLGCCYRPFGLAPARVDAASFGLGPRDRLLLCAGTPFKYAPRDDAMWVEIARRCAPCKLVFFQAQPATLSDLLARRLRAAFDAAGVDFDAHVRFIPWQPHATFFGLLDRADVFLDSPRFSGFNTAMQAVERGTPIVAWEGDSMRGRFASAILRQMGLDDWVATTADEYVDRVARLCAEPATREDVRRAIAAARGRLFDDRATVAALGEQLLALTGRA